MAPRILASALFLACCYAGAAAPAQPGKEGPAAPQAASAENPSDLLRPGDRLRFLIVEDGDPPVELVISKDGIVDMPYLGPTPSVGLTLPAFSNRLKQELERDYYVTATVRLSLLDRPDKSSNRGRIFITGQVRRVGMAEIDKSEKNTAGKVILANGGLGDFADARRIKIFRTNPAGAVETKIVDLREVLENGRIDLDVPIYDGDLVVVGSKMVNW
jgi:protein involved in polysaccharide export with SLBB domain